MTPLQRYQQDLEDGSLFPDDGQRLAIKQLQSLYDKLIQRSEIRKNLNTGTFTRLFSLFHGGKNRKPFTPIQGIYFWGGVGRGKTWLMDVLYDCLPFKAKMRTHFHRFMQRIHSELTLLKGSSNPLDLVAKKIAGEA